MQEHARVGKENQSQRVIAISDPAHQHHLHQREACSFQQPESRGERQDGPHSTCSFDKHFLGIISAGKNGQLFFRSREAKSLTAFSWSPKGTCFHSNHNLGRCCFHINYPRKIFTLGYQSWMGKKSTDSESQTSLGLVEVEETGSVLNPQRQLSAPILNCILVISC